MSRAGIVFLLAIGTTACGVSEAHSIGEASNILRSIGADVCMFGLADQTTMVDAVRGDSRFDTFERGHCAMRSRAPGHPVAGNVRIELQTNFHGFPATACGLVVRADIDTPLPFKDLIEQLDPDVARRILSATHVSNIEPAFAIATSVDGIEVWLTQMSTSSGISAQLEIDGCEVHRQHLATGLPLDFDRQHTNDESTSSAPPDVPR